MGGEEGWGVMRLMGGIRLLLEILTASRHVLGEEDDDEEEEEEEEEVEEVEGGGGVLCFVGTCVREGRGSETRRGGH